MGDSLSWAYDQEREEVEKRRTETAKREKSRRLDLLIQDLIEVSEAYPLVYETPKGKRYQLSLRREDDVIYVGKQKYE